MAKAKDLLSQAGATDLTLSLVSANDTTSLNQAQAIQQGLERVGVKVKIVPQDPNAYVATITGEQGDYDLTVSSWQPDFPSANGNISPLFDTSQIGGGGYNLSRYSNPKVDSMIALATGEVDQAKAQQDWAAADQRIMKDAPVVPLLFTRNAFLRGSDVENFDVSGFPNYPNYLRISLANG
jgi:peptide/nickel transport system substrate-binding protein